MGDVAGKRRRLSSALPRLGHASYTAGADLSLSAVSSQLEDLHRVRTSQSGCQVGTGRGKLG